MAGARQEDMSGAMMNILKKMDTMLESTNEIYQEQLFILNSIDTIQKTAVVVELQNQTKILQSIESKLDSQVSGGGGLGNVKVFKEAFGDVAGVVEKLLKATEKLDDKKSETIANFFTKLGESLNKFVKDVDAEKAKMIIESFGGKALIRGGKYITFEGEDYIRTVIWEFENIDIATKCHDSKDYQEAWSLAKNTTVRDLLIVEGV